MEPIWFVLVAVMITAYVVLDGFDLGAGVLHLLFARIEEERRIVIGIFGPVWHGDEVWLIVGGGTLYLVFALVALVVHGALYVALKTEGAVNEKSRKLARRLVPLLIVLTAFGVPVTAAVRPRTLHNFSKYPLAYVIPLVVAVSLAAMWVFERRAKEKAAFLSSCAYIATMLAGVAAALYPSLLPSSGDPARDITIYNAPTGEYVLRVGRT